MITATKLASAIASDYDRMTDYDFLGATLVTEDVPFAPAAVDFRAIPVKGGNEHRFRVTVEELTQ